MEKKKNYRYNIYLIGFMGAGKSRLGQTINRIYRLETIDTDRAIEKKEGLSVREIFESRGREYFMEREVRLMKKLSGRKGIVVSTGGGTVLQEENREIMKAGKVIYIRTPFEEILKRVKRRKTRPMIDGKSDEEIYELMKAREKIYENTADYIIDTDGKKAEEIAAEVIELLI